MQETSFGHRFAAVVRRSLIFLLWIAIAAVFFLNRDKISEAALGDLSGRTTPIAVVLMLALFALKSLTVVIHCGIIYAICGRLFPLPLALAVSAVGTVVMVTIPFFLGRQLGANGAKKLAEKYPRLAKIHEFCMENDFFFMFFVRIIGVLPSDPVSLYFGAVGANYKRYLAATLLGMTPVIGAFTVMGNSADDVTSPAFLASVFVAAGAAVISLVWFAIVQKKRKGARLDSENA